MGKIIMNLYKFREQITTIGELIGHSLS